MPRTGFFAGLALAAALSAAALPPEEPVRPSIEELCRRLQDGSPDVRAAAAAALVLDERAEARAAVEATLAAEAATAAREILLFLADRPDPRFAIALVNMLKRPNGLGEAASAALDQLGTRQPEALHKSLEESLERAPMEDRARWISAFGHVRSAAPIPGLMALLPGKDAEPAMGALRRITTLPFTAPRDWNFWWEQHRNDDLASILRDANRRLKEENASLARQLEREGQRADELEKEAVQEKLFAARDRKDAAAEVALLQKALSHPRPTLRSWAFEEVRRSIQPDDFLARVLEAAQSDPNEAVRVTAIRVAGSIGKGAAAPTLKKCIRASEPAVRQAAVAALAEAALAAGAPLLGEAAAEIEPMLRAEQPRAVRESAIAAMKLLKPKEFAEKANVLLAEEMTRSGGDKDVAKSLIELLGALGSPASVKPLVEVMRVSTDRALRFWAVKSLGEIGHADAAPALIAELDRPEAEQQADVTAVAVEALARVGGPEARVRLEKALGQFAAIPRARTNAAIGLGQIGTIESVALLVRAAKTPKEDPEVVKQAWASALRLSDGATGRLEALEALIRLVDSEPGTSDPSWRISVREIIVKPGNFPAEAAESVKKHLKPLADDTWELKDWTLARARYEDAAKAFPKDLDIQVRLVACSTRLADHARAVELGTGLLPHVPDSSSSWIDLRRFLVESHVARREYSRAAALTDQVLALPALPKAEAEAFEAEKSRIQAAGIADTEKLFQNFETWPTLQPAQKKTWLDSARLVLRWTVRRAQTLLDPATDAPLRDAASRMLAELTGLKISTEDAASLDRTQEEITRWLDQQNP